MRASVRTGRSLDRMRQPRGISAVRILGILPDALSGEGQRDDEQDEDGKG